MMAISWRMMSAAWLCVLVTSLAAVEVYDELPPGDMGLVYQEHNFIDPGPLSPLPELKEEDILGNLYLYRFLARLRNHAAAANVLDGSKWGTSGTELSPAEALDFQLMKGSVLKRMSDAAVDSKGRPAKQPVQKWKIKKGKVGSQMICYFKLCAFRPPM